jgi:hypothetical protein
VLNTGEGEAELTFDEETTLVLPLPPMRQVRSRTCCVGTPLGAGAGDAACRGAGLHPTATTLVDTRTGGFYPLVLSEDFRLAIPAT